MTLLTVKLFGACAVLLSAFIIISIRIEEKKHILNCIADFIKALKYAEDLIGINAVPLFDVMKKTAANASESRGFFAKIADGLNREDNPPLNDIWHEASDFFSDENALSSKTVGIIKHIGSRLGAMSIEIEAENLALSRRELDSEYKRLQADFEKESKLFKSLTIAMSGFIILIFI